MDLQRHTFRFSAPRPGEGRTPVSPRRRSRLPTLTTMLSCAGLWASVLNCATAAAAPTALAADRTIEDYLARIPNDWPAAIQSVVVDADAVTISGQAPPADAPSWRLLELRPNNSLTDLAPVECVVVDHTTNSAFEAAVPRFVDGYDRLLSRWVVAAGDADGQAEPRLLSAAKYADKLPTPADRIDLQRQRPLSKKGLAAVDGPASYSDVVELGIHNITINLPLALLLARPDAPDALQHEYCGHTYPINPGDVARLDRVLQFADQHDIVSSVIILAPRLPADDSRHAALTHPDAVDGHYSLANVATAEGVATYAALIDFLAQRYSRPDRQFGRIDNWIVHNEVDSAWVWTNAGERSVVSFVEQYVKSLRIVDLIARTYHPGARAFVSLDHYWTLTHEPDPQRYYPGRRVLELLCAWGRAEGNFPWGVAHHPYPENLLKPDTWNDATARDDVDTPRVTFKNIGVLMQWLQQPEHRYRGAVRPVLLSEQGFHTPDDSTASQQLQCRALRYAWEQVAPYDAIEAFHYHRRMDHPAEGGLKCGLRMLADPATGADGARKLGWYTWQELGQAP